MQKYIPFGKIIKTHGLKGELVLECDFENPYHFLKNLFFAKDNQMQPLKVEISGTLKNDRFIIKCDGIHSIEEAQTMVSKQIFVPRNKLPPSENGYYICDIIGLEAVDFNGLKIGTVVDVVDFGSGLNLEIKNLQEKLEYYVCSDDTIVDLQLGIIKVKLPEYV